ncbi:hypothetical protein GALMADRAFT_737184 [Galerina marginata CBS 339.88]|uniref:F-box domain-containing protein n=1 Tax=Galerina marginata (strain CBS 339.88) TaxID=685588 RepID=A0A067SPN1_GALM3|nr:hypothetical protein GALMADRAFT_737184 [Galerina marginata CBS 339.88]
MASLPQELIDAIIDFLVELSHNDVDQQNQQALIKCLSVSRSFYERTRPHVFKHIIWKENVGPLKLGDDQNRNQLFFQIFESNIPSDLKPLTSCVRQLSVLVCRPNKICDVRLDVSQEESDKSRNRLSRILDRFTNLDSLALHSGSSDFFNWNRLHLNMKTTIRNLCHTVTTLRFSAITELPLVVLADCINLRELRLHNIHKVNGLHCPWHPQSLRNLEIFDIHNVPGVISDIRKASQSAPPVAFLKLKECKLDLQPWMDETDLLQRASHSLEQLSLYECPVLSDQRGTMLSDFTALRSLRLRTTTRTQNTPFPTAQLGHLIMDLAPDSTLSIEEIVIEFVMFTPFGVKDIHEMFSEAYQRRWSSVDKTLTGPHYPLLRKIQLVFFEVRFPGVRDFGLPNEDAKLQMEASSARFQGYASRILPAVHLSSIERVIEYHIFNDSDPNFPQWEFS